MFGVECAVGVLYEVGVGVGSTVDAASAQVRHVVLFHSQRFNLSSQYNPPDWHGRLSYM